MFQILKLRGADLVSRYAANYGLTLTVTEEMVAAHWALEQQLRNDILGSSPGSRARVAEQAYRTLYERCPWINISTELTPEAQAQWRIVVGQVPARVYEIGSGHGSLISYLASTGHDCVGTEITSERGKRWAGTAHNLSWAATDGVHLDRFERDSDYDVVISNQVVEHLHPDDLPEHFQTAFKILRPGGRYFFTTPHRYSGPADVSRVFRERSPMGLHLREYTYRELVDLAESAGFVVGGIVTGTGEVSSRSLERMLRLERVLACAPRGVSRRKLVHAARTLGFAPNIFLALVRPLEPSASADGSA